MDESEKENKTGMQVEDINAILGSAHFKVLIVTQALSKPQRSTFFRTVYDGGALTGVLMMDWQRAV